MVRKALFTVLLLCFVSANAQNGGYLFTINGKDTVYAQEFINSYSKNNNIAAMPISKREYLDLYINYKLKLQDAKAMGLDKDSTVLQQVENYRSSLVQPYIDDPSVKDSLVKEAYDRMHTIVRVAHVLVALPKNIALKDTAEYYKKAQDIYKKARNGENFDSLVLLYSDDPAAQPSAKIPSHGDLGYFSSLTMIYPFENACYELIQKHDSIGFVRTDFGYHIIKLINYYNVDFSALTLQHIFINALEHDSVQAKRLIDSAYAELKYAKFDSITKKYSDDSYTANKAGLLVSQRPVNLPAEYIDLYMTSDLNGKASAPFRTRYGWHIVRFINADPIKPLAEVRRQIQERIAKDSRGYVAIDRFVQKAKQDYNLTVDSLVLNKVPSLLNENILEASWQIPSGNFNKTICTVGNEKQTQYDFLQFLYQNQVKQIPMDYSVYTEKMFDQFVNNIVLAYADKDLENKYPELKENIKEYFDGELIFAVTDTNVWTKAVTDTVGLNEFYERNKANYWYSPRVDAVIWTIDTSINLSKVKKYIEKSKKKGKTDDEISDYLLKKYSDKKEQTPKSRQGKINYQWHKFEKGASKIIDMCVFDKTTDIMTLSTPQTFVDTASITNRNIIVYVNEILPVSQKPLEACKGLCTSDYQKYLEQKWIEQLHAKYPVKINEKVFDEIIKDN